MAPSCPGLPHQQHKNQDNCRVPTNAPLDQKCNTSSQPFPKYQAPSGLYTDFPGPSQPKQDRLCSQSGTFYFSLLCSLFFILQTLPCLLPHFHPKAGLSASWSVKSLFGSPKLSSLIIFNTFNKLEWVSPHSLPLKRRQKVTYGDPATPRTPLETSEEENSFREGVPPWSWANVVLSSMEYLQPLKIRVRSKENREEAGRHRKGRETFQKLLPDEWEVPCAQPSPPEGWIRVIFRLHLNTKGVRIPRDSVKYCFAE